MERSEAEKLVNKTLIELDGERARTVGLVATTPFKAFDSLVGLEVGVALREAGVLETDISEEELDQVYLTGTLGDVYDIAERYLP